MTPERVKELSQLLREIEWREMQRTPEPQTILTLIGFQMWADALPLAQCMAAGLEELKQASLRKLRAQLEAA